ncbi:MAG: ribosome small subunit-dependent GTPase A [Anaerolineae bacterium]|nr:ribosome small subunit-dependent GTPase A [Anaerolineae bacterium]
MKKLQQEVADKPQRKTIRHNTAVNQEKHRVDWQPLEPDEDGLVADRRIMPRDETDRRADNVTAVTAAFDAAFDDNDWAAIADDTPYLLGVVVEVSRGLCKAEVDGRVMVCDIRGILTAEGTGFTNIVAVGDRVLVSLHEEERGLIQEVLPRRSGLARADSFDVHLKQILAANVNQMLIVASWLDPQFWPRLVDEYLIGAARNNLKAIICVNKVDLAADIGEVETAVSIYQDLGYPLYLTSADTGYGLDALSAALKDQTTVLAGLSGVGKSSLLSAMDAGLDLKTNAVSEKRHEGKHTTTQANMYPFSAGGYVVDTPGIRDFGLIGLHQEELIDFYPDIADYVVQCRFNDCTHDHEPGCAVQTAVADGQINAWRFKSYTQLFGKLSDLD